MSEERLGGGKVNEQAGLQEECSRSSSAGGHSVIFSMRAFPRTSKIEHVPVGWKG